MTSHLTRLPGVPDSAEIVPGMAYWPASGPHGKTCSTCAHYGYRREALVERPDGTFRRYWWAGCAMFKKLAGQHGPRIDPTCKACKYYKPMRKRRGRPAKTARSQGRV